MRGQQRNCDYQNKVKVKIFALKSSLLINLASVNDSLLKNKQHHDEDDVSLLPAGVPDGLQFSSNLFSVQINIFNKKY